MGKPCVSFDIDGAPEVVIPDETGYLVRPGDSEGLADAITRLLDDPDLRARMGASGRRKVDPAFRAETMVNEISNVYQKLVKKHFLRLERFEQRRHNAPAGANAFIAEPQAGHLDSGFERKYS
jgi:hypothetical protein